jgi:hypothetical protein
MLKAALLAEMARPCHTRSSVDGGGVRRILIVLAWIFSVLYLLAVAVFLVARYGVFGATPDPSSAVFLIPLGLPWIFAGDLLPLPLQPYFSLVSPLINLGILFGLASLAGRWKARRPSR